MAIYLMHVLYSADVNNSEHVSIIHHYDKLELVESKQTQEVSNPHYYNVSIKDAEVKSKDADKASLQKDKSSKECKFDTCPTQEESTVATDKQASDGTLGSNGYTMTDTNAFSESTTDDNLQCEDVSNPCYAQTPSENIYDAVNEIDRTQQKPERDSPDIHLQDKWSMHEEQIPKYAIVDKTKKSSKMKCSQMWSTPPIDESSTNSKDELYATAEDHINSDVKERSPSPQYAEVMAGKGAKDKSTMEACAMDKTSNEEEDLLVHRYDKLAKVDATIQKKDEVEQHYYYSLENPAESYAAELGSKHISHATCTGKVIPQAHNSELDAYYDTPAISEQTERVTVGEHSDAALDSHQYERGNF